MCIIKSTIYKHLFIVQTEKKKYMIVPHEKETFSKVKITLKKFNNGFAYKEI